MTIIGALTVEGLGPTTASAGNTTLGSFIAYMMEDLLPFLLPGTVIVMDRLAAHCNEQVRIAMLNPRITPADARGWIAHAGYSSP